VENATVLLGAAGSRDRPAAAPPPVSGLVMKTTTPQSAVEQQPTTWIGRVNLGRQMRTNGEQIIAKALQERLDKVGEATWLKECESEWGWARTTAYNHLNPELLEKDRARAAARRSDRLNIEPEVPAKVEPEADVPEPDFEDVKAKADATGYNLVVLAKPIGLMRYRITQRSDRKQPRSWSTWLYTDLDAVIRHISPIEPEPADGSCPECRLYWKPGKEGAEGFPQHKPSCSKATDRDRDIYTEIGERLAERDYQKTKERQAQKEERQKADRIEAESKAVTGSLRFLTKEQAKAAERDTEATMARLEADACAMPGGVDGWLKNISEDLTAIEGVDLTTDQIDTWIAISNRGDAMVAKNNARLWGAKV
jgi:hypothetical protein